MDIHFVECIILNLEASVSGGAHVMESCVAFSDR